MVKRVHQELIRNSALVLFWIRRYKLAHLSRAEEIGAGHGM